MATVAPTTGLHWDTLAAAMARDGFVVVPGALDEARLDEFVKISDLTPPNQEADYPGSDVDTAYVQASLHKTLQTDPPLLPLLDRLLDKPVFLIAWQRVGNPHSQGAPWHQDFEREFWPPAINMAIYLDEVTTENGPTLVVPGTHTFPHPVFDDRPQPRERPVVGPAGTVGLFYPTVWHRGSANTTDRPRRAIFCYYRSADSIRVRRPPDPEPGEGWILGDPGDPDPHWLLD